MASRLIRNQLPERVAGSSPVSSAARIDPPKHGSIFLRCWRLSGIRTHSTYRTTMTNTGNLN
jgi:hypothetical protein